MENKCNGCGAVDSVTKTDDGGLTCTACGLTYPPEMVGTMKVGIGNASPGPWKAERCMGGWGILSPTDPPSISGEHLFHQRILFINDEDIHNVDDIPRIIHHVNLVETLRDLCGKAYRKAGDQYSAAAVLGDQGMEQHWRGVNAAFKLMLAALSDDPGPLERLVGAGEPAGQPATRSK